MMKKEKIISKLKHVKKVKHIKWLVPGWVFYEFYKLHKTKGYSHKRSLGYGVKAEATRLFAMTSLPLPGTYELTTTCLALLKKKIESNQVKDFRLKAFKDFMPVKKLNINKNNILGKPYLKVHYRDKRIYFEIFYKK